MRSRFGSACVGSFRSTPVILTPTSSSAACSCAFGRSLDDGGILNIAGDYIAHGIRHRASELVTRELGHQSEIELQTKLQNEVEAERVTRLDKMLLGEQQEQGVIDLRPREGATFLVRENLRTVTS